MSNIREKFNEAYENTKVNLKSILLNVGVVLVSLAYIFYQILTLTPSNLNPITLISKAGLSIIVGLLIKSGLGENGFTKGYKSELWLREKQRYGAKADQAEIYIDKVDTFYDEERAEKLAKNRKTRLSGYRMHYDTFFDANGDYTHPVIVKRHLYNKLKKNDPNYTHAKNEVVLDFAQRKCLYKCIKLKIYVKNMFSEYQADLSNDERKEKTDKEQRAHTFRRNSLSAVGFSLAGVYFVPTMEWNFASIIWAVFQILAFVCFGLLNAYDNYYFIVTERVGVLKDKERDLTKFMIKNIGREEYEKRFCPKQDDEKVIELTNEQAQALFGSKKQ